MTHRMTPEQRAAVETADGDLAIRAGAGSGKTTVLAHRFSHALIPPAPGEAARTAIDRVLTITFTNKAAGEIAERVRRVVTAELGVEEGRRIGEAWISTIHAFCGRLVRRHVLESGVEPFFGTCDEVATETLKHEAFERTARRLYGSDERVTAIVDALSVGQLRERVIACYDNARALGLDPRSVRVPAGLEEIDGLAQEVSRKAGMLAVALAEANQTDSLRDKRARLEEWHSAVTACSLTDEDACARLLALDDAYDIAHLREGAQAANAELKVARACLRSALLAAMHSDALAGLEVLMREFAEQYPVVKGERSLLDFDDLQERAVALLEGDPRIAARYREHFDLIMVDEFQDTNELQMRVLAPLRADNLCVVGDERQSIYGFRYAEVGIFEELAAGMGARIPLRANFRSHAGVLGFVNAAFAMPHLFGESFMQLEPRREGDWRTGLGDEPRVECVLVDEGNADRASCRAEEARHIARRIRELVDSGVQAGDIAVLLRGASSAGTFADAIEEQGVSTLVSAGAGLFDAPEVGEVSALLRTVAVPADDHALLSVLTGPLVGLSDDALVAVRRQSGRESLWSGLQRVAAHAEETLVAIDDLDAIRHVVSAIDRLGSSAGAMRLAELVRKACEAFDYDLTLYSGGAAGVRAWDNVLKISRYADAFEQAESNDPVEFVEYLKRRGESGRDKAAPAQAGDDAVRIMTIHAAKGLEFPVVFVADLAAAKSREPEPVLVEAGEVEGERVPIVGVRLPKTSFDGATTPAYARMSERRRILDAEEEKRCLYVACTRAQELLVVSGCCSLTKPAEQGKGLIDWIREALPEGDEALLEVGGAAVGVTRLFPQATTDAMPSDWEPALPVGALFVSSDECATGHEATPIPATVSYSALRRLEQCPLRFYASHTLGLGEFRPPAESSATAFGSAVHAALQASKLRILPEQREQAIAAFFGLDATDRSELQRIVSAFLDSELAERVRTAGRFALEAPLSVPLGGALLVGSIDVIAWEGSSVLIIDYKTGRMPEDEAGGSGSPFRLQAECYALAALQAGASDVEVDFVFLQHPGVSVVECFVAAEVEALRQRLRGLLSIAEEQQPKHLAEYEERVCAGCPALGGICPVPVPAGRR